MGNHRIRYTPRDGWEGASVLKTLDLGAVPAFDDFKVAMTSKRGAIISPGRDFRSVPLDGWIEYKFAMSHIEENSQLFREITAFLSEADGGVEFEFAYDDAFTYDSTTTATRQEHEGSFDVALNPVGIVAVGDWVRVKADWRKSISGFYLVDLIALNEIGIDHTGNFFFPSGSTIRHRDFMPKCALTSHSFSKRRGGQSAIAAWDLKVSFREVE